MAPTGPALDCWTCKHRRQTEEGPGIMAGVIKQRCRKFVSSETGPLICGYAYDTFCGGGDYEPTLLTRIVRRFAG